MNKLERKGVKEIALAARQAGRARKDMMGAEREAGRSVRDQMKAMSKASVAGRQAGRATNNMRKGIADEMRGASMAKGGSVNKAPKPLSDKQLDKISPEARKMMEQKKRDVDQERKQKKMEKSVRGKKMASGGYVRKADGCISKGRTKGRMV